jgi:hypothetical protein
VHDGDLTFLASITPASIGGEQVIAESEGSWRLELTDLGTVRLTLRGDDATEVRMESRARLWPGVTAQLAFTLFGWREGAEAQLFVDAALEVASRDLRAMAVSGSAPRIGNDASGSRPFRGRVFDPRFHLMSLDASDLADLDRDGVPNGQDACIAVADAPGPDTDGDGIGDACDPDVNGDGIVGRADRIALYRALGRCEGEALFDPRLDFNGDGVVSFPDLVILERAFGAPPGPSGLVCTRERPCAAP